MKNKMLERDIEKKVCQIGKDVGMLVYKFVSPGKRNVCDRIFLFNGRVFFIEFKAKGKKPTLAQLKHHEELRKQKITVYVVDNVEDGKGIIENEFKNYGY